MPDSHNKIQNRGFVNQSPHARFGYDLDYRDTVFVYTVTMVKNNLGEDYESWVLMPTAIRASFQEHALDSQHIDPTISGSRSANVFTRSRNIVSWHDKLICRGMSFLVTQVTERFDNFDGSFHHTEISAQFLDEPGSVKRG